MNWRGVAVVSVTLLATGGSTSACSSAALADIATAAAGAAIGVLAAAAFSSASGECWGDCSYGYVCDHDRGVCVPGSQQSESGTQFTPVSRNRFCIEEDDGSMVCPDDPSTEYGSAPRPRNPGGTCQGLCYVDERCRIVDGMAYCVTQDDPLYNNEPDDNASNNGTPAESPAGS